MVYTSFASHQSHLLRHFQTGNYILIYIYIVSKRMLASYECAIRQELHIYIYIYIYIYIHTYIYVHTHTQNRKYTFRYMHKHTLTVFICSAAANECTISQEEDLELVKNYTTGIFMAACMDCEFFNATDSSEKSTSFSECMAECQLLYGCFSFEYNHSSGVCLQNFDDAGNVHVVQMPSGSRTEVWKFVSNETASMYANPTAPLTQDERIRTELVSR
jgi:hypothetical protein